MNLSDPVLLAVLAALAVAFLMAALVEFSPPTPGTPRLGRTFGREVFVGWLIGGAICAVLALGGFGYTAVLVIPAAVVFPVLFAGAPQTVRVHGDKAQEIAFWADAVAGELHNKTVQQAMISASENQRGRHADDFRAFARAMRHGTDMSQACRVLSEKLDSNLADKVLMALLIGAQSDGNVIEGVTLVAENAHKESLSAAELGAELNTLKRTVRLIGLLLAVLAAICLTLLSEELGYYQTVSGQVTAATAFYVIPGLSLWMLKLSRVGLAPRLFHVGGSS